MGGAGWGARYVPECVKHYIKLLRVQRRFPESRIHSHLVSRDAVVGRHCLISREVELAPHVSIGDYTYINAFTVIGSGAIGKFCSIGYSCQIGMPEHPLDYLSTSPRIYGRKNIFGTAEYWDDYPTPPVVENDVWIGSHVLILQGARVANGAVVAGGAVVTRDVPAYAIVAGVPAKLIRYRFTEQTIKELLEWQWWNLPDEELRRFRDLFQLKANASKSLLRLFGRS